MPAKATIVTGKVSDAKWGDIDKASQNQRAREMYAAGDLTRDEVREIWAVVKDDAFTEDADGNPKLVTKYLWGPHHELRGSGDIVLNRGGVQGAATSLGGGRAEPNLTEGELKAGKTHIRRHYREDLDIDTADLPDSLKSALLEAWDEVADDETQPDWIETIRAEMASLSDWSAQTSDSPEGADKDVALVADGIEAAVTVFDLSPRHFGGAATFDEYDAFVAAQDREWELSDLFYTFEFLLENIRNDIVLSPDDRVAAITDLVSGLQERVAAIKSVAVSITADGSMKIGARHSANDSSLIQQAHDALCRAGAVCSSDNVPNPEVIKAAEVEDQTAESITHEHPDQDQTVRPMTYKYVIAS